MKTIRVLLLISSLLCGRAANAQGKIEFHAAIEAITSEDLPDWSSGGSAVFFLEGNTFSGRAVFDAASFPLYGRLENNRGGTIANATAMRAIGAVSTAPSGPVEATWDAITLSEIQKSELLQEGWHVTIGFSQTIIQGQLQQVPEPSTQMLFGIGLALAFCLVRKRQGA